jgi:hypothetical protein
VHTPRKGAVAAAAAAAGGGGSGGLQAAFLQDLRTERELACKLKIKKVCVVAVLLLPTQCVCRAGERQLRQDSV